MASATKSAEVEAHNHSLDNISSNGSESTRTETLVGSEIEKPKVEESKPAPVDPPPDGGFTAWLQVAGSFFLLFNCWGTVNAFGVFQTYYENNPYWRAEPSDISWIGSIQACLLLMVGVITGPIYDRGYFRTLVITGSFLIPFGFMMTSLCREYWQVILAQGFIVGLGNGCLFVPSIAILPQYFTKKKALACGIASAGSSVGGIVYPIAFHKLQQSIGFGWAVRIVAFISLGTLAFSVAVMRQRIKPKQKRKLLDLSSFKELPYTFYCGAMVLAFASLYGPIYYIQLYAINERLTSSTLAFYLLPILNAASVFGRTIPNYVADRIGALNVLLPASCIAGILALVWIGIHTTGGIITFACLYGFFSGATVSLAPVGVVVLTKDMSKLGTRMGMIFFVTSLGLLCGTPVTGAIQDSGAGWLGVELFSGILLLACFVLLLGARFHEVGMNISAKI